jgi:hypothetical protein
MTRTQKLAANAAKKTQLALGDTEPTSKLWNYGPFPMIMGLTESWRLERNIDA